MPAALTVATMVEAGIGIGFGVANFVLKRRNLAALTEAEQAEYLASEEAQSELAALAGGNALREAIERFRQRRAQEAPPHGS